MSQTSTAPTSPTVSVLADGWELTGTSRGGGLGSFSRNLFRALSTRADVDLSVLARDPTAVPPGAAVHAMRRVWHERRRAHLEHELRISFTAARHPSDVLYSPVPHGVPISRRPYVQTLHDVIPLVRPDTDMAASRRSWRRWAAAYRRADAVVADSRHSAEKGIELLGLDPARVHVAHLGVDPSFHHRSGSDLPHEVLALRPYLLTVGEFSERKGFAAAAAVTAALAERGFPHRLAVAGRVPNHLRCQLDQLVASSPRPDRVTTLGRVADLASLYPGAEVFLWCSRYEGFGLPVLEAMASGVPVVAFNNSSAPEVVGEAGVLVPDGDVPAMADAVAALLRSPARRQELQEAGIAHASGFTWDRCAAIYVDVFKSVKRT